MIRSDYIMRMIEQLTQVLAKILFNKKAENFAEAEINLENAFNNLLGLNFLLINSMSTQDIITLLGITKDKNTTAIKCLITAKLLKEKTELDKLNKKKANPDSDYHKILSLYLYGINNNDNTDLDISRYYDDVDEIAQFINNELYPETRFELFKFYEIAGRYDKAENELFRLKELNYPDILAAGSSFYKKLENTSDEILLRGNLSREEVVSGYRSFLR